MAFHESYRQQFCARPANADEAAILGNAAGYNVTVEQAEVVPGEPYWRVVGVHHLSPAENQGRHAIYVDPIDENGQRVRDAQLRLRWGWAGQRADEAARPIEFTKPDNEPAANVDVYKGMHIWVEVTGDDLPCDRVIGMHSEHADEPGPQGENWNYYGHHSFYVAFQRAIKTEGQTVPVTVKPLVENPDEPKKNAGFIAIGPGAVRVREKLGIDANRPINPYNGMIEAQLIDPGIIAATGVGWVRLNFVRGPWTGPDDLTRYGGQTWVEAYQTIIDGLRAKGLRIYGLINDEAVHAHLDGEFRNPPASGDANSAWVDEYVRTFVQIVRTFKKDVAAFESFNEPDDWKKSAKVGWTETTPNWVHPGWFAIMLERIYAAVKANPTLANVPLVSGPVQGLDINNNAGAHYLASTYTHGERFFHWSKDRFPFDGIGYHLYIAQNENPNQLTEIEHDYRRYMDELRAVIHKAEGRGRPLFISEIGWESRCVPDDAKLVGCMKVGLQALLDDPSVALGIWFCTQDFEKEYGVYRRGPLQAGNRKSIFGTLQNMCRRRDETTVAARFEEIIIEIEPPVVEPPVLEPPTVEPPVVEPPVVEPPVVEPKPEPPIIPPAQGNKLGFYLHVSTNRDNLYGAIDRVQPPVILIHADTANRTLLREIRQWRAPNAFVIGRMYKDNHTQRTMLDNDDPEAHGRAFADDIINHDFGLATETGPNGRRLIDAWMSLNETVPGPGSQQFAEKPEETSRMLRNYDRFQVAFRRRLQEADIEAVAFNFGAGNFGEAAHYLDHFPGTLAEYVYLGFHEYGWPTMYPAEGSATSAATYRRCMEGIRKEYGDRHRVIMTEAGLTAMYQNTAWGDVGWLNPERTLSEDAYWASLAWYNAQMMQDDYVLGACLYEAGHHGDWVTFRHLGKDNHNRDIHIMDRIIALKDAARVASPAAMPAPPPPPTAAEPPSPITINGTVTLHGVNVTGASVRLIGGQETLGAVRGAMLDAPSYATWSRRTAGLSGTTWQVWLREVAQPVAAISWSEFKRQVAIYNPGLADDNGRFQPEKPYWLPENRAVAVEIVWDRPLTGFEGTLWQCWQRFVQNKVVGLNYALFKRLAATQNPALATTGRFVAGQRYTLPRNADHKTYALQTWTHSRGGFTFTDLPPGAYELAVNAPGALSYKSAFSTDGDLTLNVLLSPTVLATPAMAVGMPRATGHDFVRTAGDEFVENGRAFRFIGVNIRGLVHYGDGHTLKHAQQSHQAKQLEEAYNMGARVVRVFLPSMHVAVEDTINRLRAVTAMVQERFPGLYILPAFANLYADVPFRIPGDESFYAKIDPNFHADLLKADFFQGGYTQNFLPYVRKVVPAFKDDPVIFAWEVGNELKLDPHGAVSMDNPRLAAFMNFMHLSAREIRSLDPNHMITTGMISTRHASLKNSPLARRLYDTDLFDFLTVHCYNEEYDNDDSKLAQALGKPYIIEEAGFGRGYGGDRSGMVVRDMDRWFGGDAPARGYMQWGFMATAHDMGDGDDDSGMDRSLHGDWDPLFRVYKERADALARHRPEISAPPLTPPKPPKSANFSVGTTVYAQTMVNVRRTPGYVNQPDEDVVLMLEIGQAVTIIGEAEARDGLIWWPIKITLSAGEETRAWAAESVPGQLLISAATPPLGMPMGPGQVEVWG